MSLFEIATRKKYRFPFRGTISTEDLWDLPLRDLDTIYKTLSKANKTEKEEESLLTERSENTDLNNMIEIVKHVFGVKKSEIEEARNKDEKKKKKDRLLEILAQKQDDALASKSVDEIKQMIDELE